MALAAGLGLRLRPITDTTPKPLVRVGGRTMLDRALDALAAAGVRDAVVNTHHLGEKIEKHLSGRSAPSIEISREDALLETGGGVVRALPLLGAAPFFIVNADIVWHDGPVPALDRLAAAWDDDAMDVLLLLHPVADAVGYAGAGDYARDADGRLTRRRDAPAAPYVFAGVQMVHPRLFDGAPDGKFSMTVLFDRAEAAGRLYGLVHDGGWYHVGTPAALDEANAALAAAEGTGAG